MSSAADFHAKTSHSLASALASRVLAAVSGLSTSASFASFGPDSSSLKTCQLSLLEDWTSSSADLPKAGTMRSGSLYELPTLARPTDESDCSSWPTATVKGNHNRKGLSPTSGDGLATAATLWATPTARDWKDGACADADVPTNGLLGRQAPRWPTPSACMANDSEDPETWLARRELLKAKAMNGNGAGMPLAIAAKLHTSSRPDPVTTTDGEST